MGGGLAFLNKKGWHPGSLRNQEKVWAREQERDAENRRADELKEQIEQERAQEEMRGLAKKAGIKQKGNSMDWMYQGSMRAREEADQRVAPAADSSAAAPAGVQVQQEVQVQLPAFLTEDTPASANEVWVRLHSDPLFAIKQQEIAARKSVMANPVQMDAIKLRATKQQASLAQQQQQKAERKQAKKDAKAAKKAKKQARKAKGDAGSDSDADEQPAKVRRIEGPAAVTNTAPPANDRDTNRDRDRDLDHRAVANGNSHRGHEHRRDNDGPHHRSHHSRDIARSSRDDDRSRGDDRGRYDDRRHDPRGSDRPRHDSSSRGRQEGSHARRGIDSAAHHREPDRRAAAQADREHQADRGRPHENEAGRQDERKGDYGLRMSGAAPANMAEQDRSAAVSATRAALEKAAAAKEEEERLKASQRYVKREYKTGQLTEEDRAQRLAEMTGNASVHEEARWQRLANARRKDQQSEDAPPPADAGNGRGPGSQQQDFVKTVTKDLYGSGDGGSVQDQVGRRKYYSERRSDEAAFRR